MGWERIHLMLTELYVRSQTMDFSIPLRVVRGVFTRLKSGHR